MASNEELAVRLQRGDTTATARLWEQNKGWGYTIARRFRSLAERNRAADMDDLMQCAFLGMLEAARAYDADRGAFSNLMRWYVMRECQDLLGLRGRGRPENYSLSADAPLDDESSTTLADTPEDTSLPGMNDALELEALQEAVHATLSRLPERERDIVRRLYLAGESTQAVAQSMGVSPGRVHEIKHRAFVKLARNRFLQREYQPSYYRRKGVQAFFSSGSSTVEDLVLWLEEHREPVKT